MSLRIECVVICDNCGEETAPSRDHRATYAKETVFAARVKAERAGWLTVPRGRYNTEAHYCRECADKPMKPIPKPRVE